MRIINRCTYRRFVALQFLAAAAAMCVCALPLRAQSSAPSGPSSSAQAQVAAAVRGFHEALARGDSTEMLRLLAPDVRILEAGGVETRSDYQRGHLAGDIAYARAVPAKWAEPLITIVGDVAWVTSTSKTEGTYNGRAINSAGAELMVLARSAEGWQIRAIHWSSRNIRTEPAKDFESRD